MLEIMNFIAQDENHFFGTLLIIGALSGFVISIGKAVGYAIHGSIKEED